MNLRHILSSVLYKRKRGIKNTKKLLPVWTGLVAKSITSPDRRKCVIVRTEAGFVGMGEGFGEGAPPPQ